MVHGPLREPAALSGSDGTGRTAALVAAAVLGALTLVSAAQLYTFRRASNEGVSVTSALLFGVATWGVWVAAVPVIIVLGRRFDFRPGRRVVSVVVHTTALLVIHLPATMLVLAVGLRLFGNGEAPPWREAARQALVGTRLHFAAVLYAALLGLARAVETRRHLRNEQERAARSEALATQARLAALAARLQPHFLFNALHAAGALIDEDPARARAMLAQLGDLLRDALADGESGDVPLAEEFRLLERYLAIEAVRFADRLRVELVCDDAVQDAPVPRFLLQPLVENALQHGIAPRASGGRVSVTAHAVGGGLGIRVFNDGLPPPAQLHERGGLGMTRDRLRTRYGAGAHLELTAPDGGGAEAVLTIPLHPADAT